MTRYCSAVSPWIPRSYMNAGESPGPARVAGRPQGSPLCTWTRFRVDNFCPRFRLPFYFFSSLGVCWGPPPRSGGLQLPLGEPDGDRRGFHHLVHSLPLLLLPVGIQISVKRVKTIYFLHDSALAAITVYRLELVNSPAVP